MLKAAGRDESVLECGAHWSSHQAVLIDQQTGKQYGAADDRREGLEVGLPRPRGR